MKLEQFGCRVPQGVYQEFYAHIFMMNMVTILGNQAQEEIEVKTKNRKGKYQYNWQTAFNLVREQFALLFNFETIEYILELLNNQIMGSLTMIKPGRSFERHRDKRKHRFVQCYKYEG